MIRRRSRATLIPWVFPFILIYQFAVMKRGVRTPSSELLAVLFFHPTKSDSDDGVVLTPVLETENQTTIQKVNVSPSMVGNYELCFLTSVFADDIASADTVANVTEHRQNNPTFQYLLFTNQKDLSAPGWTKIIPTLHFRRMITQSRWAKFLPWQHEETKRMCPVIFYMDGYTVPLNTPEASHNFRRAAQMILDHPFGLGQYPKRGTKIHKLAKLIVRTGKDTADNVNYTMSWLHAQSDFRQTCTVYWNRHLGIDPQNLNYQNLSLYFWELYSQEQGSWRDQLLWCYVVDKFKAHPINLIRKVCLMRDLFQERRENMGYNGHTYVDDK